MENLIYGNMESYLAMCQFQKSLNIKTLKAYRIDLRQTAEYLTEQEFALDRDAVKAYAAELNRKYKPRTVKRKIASLRAFCNWLKEESRIAESPFANLRIRIQEPLVLPKVIPLRVIQQLLEAVHTRLRQEPEKRETLRDAVVFELLFATGMRVSELCDLKASDVNLADGQILIHGKGSKERVIQLVNREVLALLRHYAQLRRAEHNETFLQSRDKKRLSEQSVRRILRKYAGIIGTEIRITPHMFRHSLATQLLENDVDIRYIQQLLGHASIVTTQIYTHVAGAKQRDILMQKHPRNQFTFQAGT